MLYRETGGLIMYLQDSKSGHMVEVLSMKDLLDPFDTEIVGRLHFGEEVQEPEKFAKAELAFLSGEPLPKCWTDPHYRDQQQKSA
jgi:hypothetical protein